MSYPEWAIDVGFALLMSGVSGAVVLRILLKKKGLKVPRNKIWRIAPAVLTAAACILATYYTFFDHESSLAWVFFLPFIPMFWGAALTIRLFWHFVRPSSRAQNISHR